MVVCLSCVNADKLASVKRHPTTVCLPYTPNNPAVGPPVFHMPAVGSDLGNDERVSECLCGENESHSWNAGPLFGCLPPLRVDLFLSHQQNSVRLMPTHSYTSHSPFLESKNQPSFAVREDYSSNTPSHPLWFHVVMKSSIALCLYNLDLFNLSSICSVC